LSSLDRRLQLTKETGYEGFEAKPAEEVRAKCKALGIVCAAIGGGVREGIDYAAAAGAAIVRATFPKEDGKRWADYAGARRCGGVGLLLHDVR
jgi:hypothetical protein